MTKYQGKEFQTTIQANDLKTLNRLIGIERKQAKALHMDFKVLDKSKDPDGGWKCTVASHNMNPIEWIKGHVGKGHEERLANYKARDEERRVEKFKEDQTQKEIKVQTAELSRDKAQEDRNRVQRIALARTAERTAKQETFKAEHPNLVKARTQLKTTSIKALVNTGKGVRSIARGGGELLRNKISSRKVSGETYYRTGELKTRDFSTSKGGTSKNQASQFAGIRTSVLAGTGSGLHPAKGMGTTNPLRAGMNLSHLRMPLGVKSTSKKVPIPKLRLF